MYALKNSRPRWSAPIELPVCVMYMLYIMSYHTPVYVTYMPYVMYGTFVCDTDVYMYFYLFMFYIYV